MKNIYYLKDVSCRDGFVEDPVFSDSAEIQVKPGTYKCYVVQEGNPDEQCVTVATFIVHEDIDEDPATIYRKSLECTPALDANGWLYAGDHGACGLTELYTHYGDDFEINALLLKGAEKTEEK